MLKKGFLFLFIFKMSLSFAQEIKNTTFKNGIDNPSTLTTHHFGIFSSRINQNFKIRPPKNSMLNFSMESGNTMHPFVEAYFPKTPQVRKALSQVIWHDRDFTFIDQIATPADYMNIVSDIVIKGFRVDFNTKLSDKHELKISVRSYFASSGKLPFSFISGDESIEWFHSNIIGVTDPFGRNYYGLNKVDFKYTDRNGRVLKLNKGDFFIGGFELNHFYYPTLKINATQRIFVNLGSHLGINTSKYNSSVDIGFSVNALKNIKLKSGNDLNITFGTNVLRKNVVNFSDENIELGNNKFLGSFETEIEYTKFTKNKNFNSFGIIFQYQTRFNKKKEANYYKLLGKWQEIHAGWHHGISTMYTSLSNWTFIYSYGTPKYKFTIYLKEDLLVNNAPDLQTGISLKIPISKK